MSEQWRPVAGYEHYQISDQGHIRNGDKVLKTFLTGKAPMDMRYPTIQLHKDGHHARLRIHRLMAIAFLPNPENKLQVNHKNGIKTDNRLENLEWSTPSENTKHSYFVLRNPLTGNPVALRQRTHCKRGHEYTKENTYLQNGKWRICRACALYKQRLLRASKPKGDTPDEQNI